MTIRASKSQSKLRRYQEGIIAIVALSGTLVSAHVQPSTSTSIAAHRHVGAFVTTRHNIILFIPDGLRPSSITPQDTPALASLAQDGVGFLNSHALYPTINTTNAAAFLSGQLPGDTGAYADRFFDEPPVNAASNSTLPGLEYGNIHSAILAAFAGSDLYPTSILDDANEAGYATAVIGPSALFHMPASHGTSTVVINDATGSADGVPLNQATQRLLHDAGLAVFPPKTDEAASSLTPPVIDAQDRYFTAVATQALLPYYAAHHVPFVLIIGSHEPAATQRKQNDSVQNLVPGINGAPSLAAIQRTDQNLGRLRAAVIRLGLGVTTDILVASSHGASTISRHSKSSYATSLVSAAVQPHELPPDFVGIDLGHALNLALFDTTAPFRALDVSAGQFPPHDGLLLGHDAARPKALVVAGGGSDYIYLLGPTLDRAFAARIVQILAAEDYTSGIFVDDRVGKIGGAFPFSAIHLVGTARTPRPTIIVNFRSFTTACAQGRQCTVEVADTRLHQGQSVQGGFDRADTANFMAAWGPDFRPHLIDLKPVSTADYGITMAYILQLHPAHRGGLTGRMLDEALRCPAGNKKPQPVTMRLMNSMPAADGRVTVLREQIYDGEHYFDAAGYLGRTVGL